MVNVIITGGAGFLGARLAREILTAGELGVAGEPARPVSRLILLDQVPAPADLLADARVTGLQGDVAALVGADDPRPDEGTTPGEGTALGEGTAPGYGAGTSALTSADVIFHLAAAVSGECEADFDLGMRANLRATEALFAACRARGSHPVVVFASSLAVFGGSGEHPLPAVVDDQTLPNPQTSYGTQKFIAEQLLADYTRKGFFRGRAVRLVTVSVRPGRPNGAASGFLSSIIREPLAGRRARCPVDPATEAALASPGKAVEALLCAATSTDEAWDGRSAVTMPALTVSVAEMVAALGRIAGREVSDLIDWDPDPEIARMMASWPARVRADRAARLGLTPDPDFDSVIRMHIAESTRAVAR